MNSTAETSIKSPRASLIASCRGNELLDLGDPLGDLLRRGVGAEDRRQTLAIDDDGDRHLGHRVAVADGGDTLRVHLVVGGFLLAFALLGRLRPVGRRDVCLRQVLLDACRRGGRLLAVVLVGADDLDGPLDARFRIEDRLFGLARVGVDLGLDAGAEIVRAEIGGERAADIVLDLRLDGALDAERAADAGVVRVVAGGKQGAAGIEHGDVLGVEAGHCGGDQVADRGGGAGGVHLGGADDHGGGRLLRVATEVGAFRHDDVDARSADAGYRLDGAGDLAFQRTHAGDLLHEGGETERADIVEELVAGVGAGRQALLGEQHARLRRLACRHQHRRAVGGDVEADTALAEHKADLVHVGAFEADIERLVGGTVEIDGGDADD